MITRFSIIFGRAPRHPPGKEGVVKMVGINFHLFLWLLSPIGGEAAYVVKMSEWVSDGNNRILILTQFLPDAHCATCYLFRSSIDDYKHLTIISGLRVKKQSLFLKEIPHKVWSAHHENLEENLFSLKGEYFTVWISEWCPVDRKILFFLFLPLHYKRW